MYRKPGYAGTLEHRLMGYALQMWLLKRAGKWVNSYPADWHPSQRSLSLDAVEVKRNLRHAIWQGSRDLSRRGRSNREGSKNRRWRKWKAEYDKQNPPHEFISWPDYGLDARDFAG